MIRLIVILAMIVFPVWLVVVGGFGAGWVIGVIVAAVVGYFLTTLVHELGHALIGTLEGLPLRWLAVGPFMVDFTTSRRLRRSPFGGAVGGCAVFNLGDLTDRQVGGALCRMSAGGPVASLLLAVVCLGVEVAIPGLPFAVATSLQLLGGYSLLVGLSNAIPFRLGPFRSDGCTYLILLRGGEAAESLVRAARLTETAQSQDRPADWPATIVTRLKETLIRLDAPPPARLDEWLASAELLYWHHVDRGHLNDAREVLRRVAVVPRDPALVKRHRYESINLQTALHLALWDGDVATAARIAEQVPKRSLARNTTLWTGTEAAILLARGDATGALKKAREAQRRLAPFVDLLGVIALEQRWWATLIARAEAAIAQVEYQLETPLAAVPAVAPVEWFAPAPPAESPPPLVGSSRTAWPETALWLERGLPVAEANGHQSPPAPFPLPTIVATKSAPQVRPTAAPVPKAPVPIAMLKAAGATVSLAIAVLVAVLAFAIKPRQHIRGGGGEDRWPEPAGIGAGAHWLAPLASVRTEQATSQRCDQSRPILIGGGDPLAARPDPPAGRLAPPCRGTGWPFRPPRHSRQAA